MMFPVIISVLLLAASLHGEDLPRSIRVLTLKGPTGMGMMELLEKGKLLLPDGRSIPLEVEIASSPELADARMAGGQADFSTIPVNQAARLRTKGVDIRLGGVNVWGVMYLLALEPSAVLKADPWKALRGQTVHSTGRGASPDAVVRTLAGLHGLDPEKDMSLDYRFNQVQIAALMAEGKISLAFLPEPFATGVLRKNTSAAIILDVQKDWAATHGGREIPQGGLAVSGSFADRWPLVARAFLDAYRDSTATASDPASADRIAALGLGIDADSYRLAVLRLNLRYRSGIQSRKDVEAYLSALSGQEGSSPTVKLPDPAFYME